MANMWGGVIKLMLVALVAVEGETIENIDLKEAINNDLTRLGRWLMNIELEEKSNFHFQAAREFRRRRCRSRSRLSAPALVGKS